MQLLTHEASLKPLSAQALPTMPTPDAALMRSRLSHQEVAMLLICHHCQNRNQVPEAALRLDPSCERCSRSLASGELIELDESNFDAVVRGSELPILVDFWAPWSGPARMMTPQLSQAARQLKGRALLVRINSDTSPHLARRFGIGSIPTLAQLRGGQELQRINGPLQAHEILAWMQ